MVKSIGAIALGIAGLAACSTTTKAGHGKSYVLVHGAWMGQTGWQSVADELRAASATVETLDLPAHGADTTPVAGATLDAYVAAVSAAIDRAPRPVILVGHSMAGVVISQVAEQRPADLASLVYVAAYVPTNGQTLFALVGSDADSQINPSLIQDPDGTLGIQSAAFPDLFCADCDGDGRTALVAGYRVEPAAPFQQPVTLTAANEGAVAKTYVHTSQDRVVSPALQARMVAATPMRDEFTLDTSHAAMLSQPAELADRLLAE